ncbi:MAG: sodium-translocating pyrophosphatase [Candidatus Parcubacteria bacterium]|jgi:K(+)-stimulated pyrophosphate-energized sodium pump
MEKLNLLILFVAALTSLSVLIMKSRWLRRQEVTEPELLKISAYIKSGVLSFLKRQYTSSGVIIGIVFLILLVLAYLDFISFYTPFAVLTGAFFSALSAYFGMTAATRANAITAHQTKNGLNKGFKAALNGGAVMGFSVCGFVLLDLGLWYSTIYLLSPNMPANELMGVITSTVITFSFGSSFMAFMARVAGGIFTKAADFAADVVGKGEYGLEEDDARNPATIADNVGDNASDIAGMGQDLNESYAGGNAASMEAGFAAHGNYSLVYGTAITASVLVMLPLAISAIGIFASIIGLAVIKADSYDGLLKGVRRGIYLTSILIAIGAAIVIGLAMPNLNLWFSVLFGLITGNAISYVAEYYTSADFKPVKKLAEKANDGHPSVIVEGISLGMRSVLVTALVLVIGMLAAFFISGGGDYQIGIYGVSLAAVAMLSTLPITLTVDAFGPIADNAQGLIEMTHLGPERAKIGNSLDSLGNTTAATGKGYAIGSAAFAAIALIGALWNVIEAAMTKQGIPSAIVNLDVRDIWIISGLILGVAVPWLFSAKLLKAVGDAASVMIHEVKRQIKDLNLLAGKNQPDYQKCVDISTRAAQRFSIAPALLVIFIPLIIAIIGGPAMIVTFLLATLASGFCQAVYMANAGGAWDNAKKYIESGMFGGKNSPAHKAAITGDMVGDPFKDTAGPSLNILIKLMVTVSILTAPVTVYLHYLIF